MPPKALPAVTIECLPSSVCADTVGICCYVRAFGALGWWWPDRRMSMYRVWGDGSLSFASTQERRSSRCSQRPSLLVRHGQKGRVLALEQRRDGEKGGGQGLTLVHFSAQLEPFPTQKMLCILRNTP